MIIRPSLLALKITLTSSKEVFDNSNHKICRHQFVISHLLFGVTNEMNPLSFTPEKEEKKFSSDGNYSSIT